MHPVYLIKRTIIKSNELKTLLDLKKINSNDWGSNPGSSIFSVFFLSLFRQATVAPRVVIKTLQASFMFANHPVIFLSSFWWEKIEKNTLLCFP
jgi:hypothetical protein